MSISKTNLLPYRKIRRDEKKREFSLNAILSLVVAGAVVFLGQQHFSSETGNQESRNQRIKDAIVVLDTQIAEITSLKQSIKKVLDRKNIIESLQSGRNSTVALMNELSLILPEGVTVNDLKQNGNSIQISGLSGSESKVAELITNITKSTVFESPKLVEIKLVDDKATGSGRSSFSLSFIQHVDSLEKESKKGK